MVMFVKSMFGKLCSSASDHMQMAINLSVNDLQDCWDPITQSSFQAVWGHMWPHIFCGMKALASCQSLQDVAVVWFRFDLVASVQLFWQSLGNGGKTVLMSFFHCYSLLLKEHGLLDGKSSRRKGFFFFSRCAPNPEFLIQPVMLTLQVTSS